MCVLSIKVPIRKKSENLFNDPSVYIYIYMCVCGGVVRKLLNLTLEDLRKQYSSPWYTNALGPKYSSTEILSQKKVASCPPKTPSAYIWPLPKWRPCVLDLNLGNRRQIEISLVNQREGVAVQIINWILQLLLFKQYEWVRHPRVRVH